MAKQPKPKKLTYGIDAAVIGLAKLASEENDWVDGDLTRVQISDGRAYVANGFIAASAALPDADPSDLDEDSAVTFPADDIAGLPWEDFTQRTYSLVDVKDTRLGTVFRSGDTVRLAHGRPPDPKNKRLIDAHGIGDIVKAQGIADAEPATTVLSIGLLGQILDVLREVADRTEGVDYYGGGLVLRIYPDADLPAQMAPRAVEWIYALPDGRTIEGLLMPMAVPEIRAIAPHWRAQEGGATDGE